MVIENLKDRNHQVLIKKQQNSSQRGKEKFAQIPTGSRDAQTGPPVQWETGGTSVVAKRWGREADHLLSSSVEAKKEWSCVLTLPYAFMAFT